jgi:hypothetical protein
MLRSNQPGRTGGYCNNTLNVLAIRIFLVRWLVFRQLFRERETRNIELIPGVLCGLVGMG